MDSNNKLEVSSQPSAAWSSLNPPHYGSHYDVTQRDFQQSWQHYNYPPDSHFGLSNDVQNMYGNDISHQQSLHSSTFMSTPSNAGHTTFLTHSVAPRVHINPNYRPKGPPPTRKNSKRTLSVHVNPHWKGRLEPSASGEESISVKSDNSAPSSKKTIFVNPKVLAQIKMTAPKSSGGGPSVCVKTVNSSNNFSSNFHSQPEGKMKAAEDFSMAEKMKVDQEIIKEEVKTLCVQPPTIPMPSFSKLIQRSSTSSDPKQSILNQVNIQKPYCSRILKPVPEKAGVKSVNPAYHSLKIAKQVCSKYKLVHNASSIISKLTNCTPADTPGRLRRKSLNSKLSFQLKPKSAYKFVRTPTQSNDSCLHSKAQKSSRKNLKTRFKLVKIQTHQQGKSGGPETINPKTVKSRYKLVHLDSLQGKLSSRNVPRGLQPSGVLSLPQQSPLIRSRYKFVRGISVNKVKQARKVSRFRIVQSSSSPRFKANNSPLKILRRTPQTLTFSNPLVKGHGLYGNRIWRKEAVMLTSSLKANPSSPSPVHSSKSRRNALMYNKIYSRNLLNIGGVYYRSTPTSLTRTHSAKLKESIVCIRGKRFILDEKGTTLRPAFGPGASIDRDSSRKRQLSFDRVDFGGITFMKGSGNTLVRTNHHYTRNILSNAKMRSIALLRGKLSKNNQPCLIYHRFGKCHGHEEGKCWRVHDPKNIAICPKFLQDACNADMCLLSHDIGPEKMPTCRFFLEGCCVRDNCPYLHVKLSAHAPICRQFLHGYCSAGNKCKKRHVYLCPDFDQDGKCCKGKRCPYPHKSKDRKVLQREARNYRKEGLRKTRGESEKKPNECQTVSSYNGETEKRKRYYDNSPFGTETKSSQENEAFNVECEFFDNVSPSSKRANDSQNELVDERSPIGALPAYIPLE